ncbi:MAG: hypothetical protein AABM67_12600 [Acidobacteriota bacterium]
MKREESLLKLLCVLVALGFFALIVYNFFAGGSIISTDGLFFTVVPMVLALCFLAVPAFGVVSRVLERRGLVAGGSTPQLAAAGGATWVPGARTVPALKDARGRALPADVNRMVAEMNAPRSKES